MPAESAMPCFCFGPIGAVGASWPKVCRGSWLGVFFCQRTPFTDTKNARGFSPADWPGGGHGHRIGGFSPDHAAVRVQVQMPHDCAPGAVRRLE